MKKYSSGLIFVIALFALLYIGRALLIPLVLAVFIGYLITVLSDAVLDLLSGKYFKSKRHRSGGASAPPSKALRAVASVVSLVIIVGGIYFTSLLVMKNITEVAAAAPAYQYNLDQMTRRLLAMIPWHEPLTINSMVGEIDISSMTRGALREVTGFFGKGTLVAVYLLFIFLEQRTFKNKLSELFPEPERQAEVKEIMREIDADVRKYLGIKTVASLTTAFLSYLVFKSVGLNFASFWALLVFLLNFIPTIGSIVSTLLPSLLALVQFETFTPVLVVLIGVASIQTVIGNILEPRIQGDNLNLSPLVILLSLALWNIIWGIPGMFLCVPMTAVALIICSHFPSTEKIAIALSRNGKIGAAAKEALKRIAQTRTQMQTLAQMQAQQAQNQMLQAAQMSQAQMQTSTAIQTPAQTQPQTPIQTPLQAQPEKK